MGGDQRPSGSAAAPGIAEKQARFGEPHLIRPRGQDGRMLDLTPADPQLHHIDRAWASTVTRFRGARWIR